MHKYPQPAIKAKPWKKKKKAQSHQKCTVCTVHKTPSKASLVLTRAESLGTAETFYLSVVGNVSHRQPLCRICEHLLASQGRAGAGWVCLRWCARLSVNFHVYLPHLHKTERKQQAGTSCPPRNRLESFWGPWKIRWPKPSGIIRAWCQQQQNTGQVWNLEAQDTWAKQLCGHCGHCHLS